MIYMHQILFAVHTIIKFNAIFMYWKRILKSYFFEVLKRILLPVYLFPIYIYLFSCICLNLNKILSYSAKCQSHVWGEWSNLYILLIIYTTYILETSILSGKKVGETPDDIVCREYPIDVTFLVDGSDSIVRDDFATTQQWMLNVIDAFNPASRPDGLLVDIVQFSHVTELEINQLITSSSDQIKDQVLNIDQMRSGTKTFSALEYVNRQVRPLLRAGSYKILITLTDGDASESRNVQAVQEARNNFNKMIAVGVGEKTDKEELLDFSSSGRVFNIDNFEELETIIKQVIDSICSGVNEIVLEGN